MRKIKFEYIISKGTGNYLKPEKCLIGRKYCRIIFGKDNCKYLGGVFYNELTREDLGGFIVCFCPNSMEFIKE